MSAARRCLITDKLMASMLAPRTTRLPCRSRYVGQLMATLSWDVLVAARLAATVRASATPSWDVPVAARPVATVRAAWTSTLAPRATRLPCRSRQLGRLCDSPVASYDLPESQAQRGRR